MEILDKKILKIHNYIYANDGLSNSETLNEFLKIFYCKIIDEQNENLLNRSNTDDEIISIINNLFTKLKIILKDFIDTKEIINLKKETICFIIRELKEIKLNSISADTKGHILQKIIDRSYRESRGQFFTPSPVVDFIVKMIEPQKNEVGCDPASGTGGFMFSALEYISQNENFSKDDISNVYFFDISKSLIKLIAMRMMFEFSTTNAHYSVCDSISSNYNLEFDYILTNPPFGTQGKISDSKILAKYDLGSDGKKRLNSQVPDILFVEKVIKLLKINGRAAIVLPDGDFENPSLQYFREYLIKNVKIDAIISLPDGTFIPYGTGVKSSIIFFTKLDKENLEKRKEENYNIFFGKITKLGYTFSKHSKDLVDKDGNIDEDYTNVLNSYKNKIYDNNNYIIPISKIILNNYNLSESFYSPVYEKTIEDIKKNNYVKLKDIVEFNYSKEKFDDNEVYNYIEIADINSYTGEIINSTEILGEDLPSRASYKLKENDIIVATSGNAIGTKKQTKAFITSNFEGCICTNGFTVMKSKKYSPYFLLHFFNSENFLNQMLKYKYGTAIPCVGRVDFENILVPIPNDKEIEFIEDKIKQAINLREEAIRLMNF